MAINSHKNKESLLKSAKYKILVRETDSNAGDEVKQQLLSA